jgi:hypothetical protein
MTLANVNSTLKYAGNPRWTNAPSGPGHRNDGAGRTLLNEGMRAEGLGRTSPQRRQHGVVAPECGGQLVDETRVATLHTEERMPTTTT